jgi:hypothetical protein
MSLYSKSSRTQATADQVRSFSQAHGVTDPKAIAQLTATIVPKLGQLLSQHTGTDAEARRLTALVLRQAVHKPTGEQVSAWNQHSFADLRTRTRSNREASALIHETNDWLKRAHPETHKALGETGLGSHPAVVRKAVEAYVAQKPKAHQGKWLKSARTDQRAAALPRGGMLAGNGEVAANALRSLGKSPLGSGT